MILTPTTSAAAPPLEASGDFTATLFAGQPMTYHTAYWNILGNPALSMPIGFNADGLPLAAQLVGRPFAEAMVLRTADAYQQSTQWHLAQAPQIAPTQAPQWISGVLESPTVTDDQLATTRHRLALSGISVPEAELPGLAASLPLVRHNAEFVYSLSATRYAVPAAEFPADGVRG